MNIPEVLQEKIINDAFVMKAWLKDYECGDKIIGIADGNGELSSALKVLVDKLLKIEKFFLQIQENNQKVYMKNKIKKLILKQQLQQRKEMTSNLRYIFLQMNIKEPQ